MRDHEVKRTVHRAKTNGNVTDYRKTHLRHVVRDAIVQRGLNVTQSLTMSRFTEGY